MFTSHAHVAAASGAASARVSSGGSSVDAATVADWSRIVAATLARGIIATLLGLAFWAAAPAVVGWQPTTVMTGSMMPRVAVGDVVISRPIDSARLDAGQVLLFDDPDHEGALRLHRVDSTAPDGTLITKGDANAAADSSSVPRDDVHGIGVLRVPLIGMPIVWLHDGDAAHLVLAGLAFVVLIAVTLLDGPLRRRPEPDPSTVAGRTHGRHGGGPAGGGSGGAGRAGARAAGSGRGGIHRAGVAVGRMLRVVAPAAHVQEVRDRRSRTAPPRLPGSAGVGTRRLVLVERRAAHRRRRLLWGSGLSALVIATAGIGFVLPATAIAAPFLATTVNPKSSWTAGMVGQPAAVPNTTTLGCVNAGSNGVTITFAYPAGADADSFELQGPGLLNIGTVTYGSTAASSATSGPNSTKSVTFTPTAGLNLNLASTVKVKAVLGATGTLWTSTSDATTGVTVSLLNGLRCR
ncbi:signal peptidase I [Frigoribacterium sp. CFBP 13712]|uniref:signal peptidase I n=1 Tax=Frigoribacterium sp. CFBP 13712 TaxID=2775309 RepID=UPI00178626AF|nr:signal peptidase I [Frigoribacterium sp. CFBP 13712]